MNSFIAQAEPAKLTLEDIEDLSKIYSTDLIDKQHLLANVQDLLQSKSQVSLNEVIQIKGLSKGLAELLAYVSLVNTNHKFFINESVRELIPFQPASEKYLDLPQIIFTN